MRVVPPPCRIIFCIIVCVFHVICCALFFGAAFFIVDRFELPQFVAFVVMYLMGGLFGYILRMDHIHFLEVQEDEE